MGIAILFSFSCSSGGSSDKAASATVPVTGGTVSTPGGTAIEVPDGALGAAATIGITPVDLNPAGVTRLSNAYRFTPSGQTFAKPVTVRIKVTESIKGTPLLFWSKEGDESKFEAVTGVLSNGVYTAEVNHFSVGFVGEDATSPGVGGIFPDNGANNGVITVPEIRGINFQPNVAVKLTRQGAADLPAGNVVVTGGSLISCTFDLNGKTPGLWNVVVVNPDGTTGILPYGFSIYNPRPEILSIDPPIGNNDGVINDVRIYGAYFREGTLVKLVKPGQPEIVAINVAMPESWEIDCSFDLTGAEAGSWNVVVQNDDTQYGILVGGFDIRWSPQTITSITPSHGYNNGTVTISNLAGTGFRPDTQVMLTQRVGIYDWEEIHATDVVVVSPQKITCVFDLTGRPFLSPWDVVVTSQDAGYFKMENGFTIMPPPPQIVSISPASGKDDETDFKAMVTGTYFRPGASVKLSKAGQADINATNVVVLNGTTLTCSFNLEDAAPGAWDLTVSNVDGPTAQLQQAFSITEAPRWRQLGDTESKSGDIPVSFGVYDGVPYIGFNDYQNNHEAVVKRFNGQTWEKVGGTGVTLTADSQLSMSVSSGVPHIAYSDPVNHFAVTVKKYDGSSWGSIGNTGIQSRALDGVSSNSLVLINDMPYVASPAIDDSIHLVGYDGNNWNEIYKSFPGADPDQQLTSFSQDLYIAFSRYYGRHVVHCINGSCESLPDCGWNRIPTLFADESGVFLGSETGWPGDKATVSHYRSDEELWEEFAFTEEHTNDSPISGFRSGGVVYLSYEGDEYPNAMHLVKSAAPADPWIPVGKPLAATGSAGTSTLKFYNGIAYLAVKEIGTNKIQVYNYSLLHQQPVIGGISPESGLNSEKTLSVTVEGTGFRSGATVRLLRAGQSDIWATNVVVQSGTQISCEFDLTGRELGLWSFIITNDDAKSAVLQNGFRIDDKWWQEIGVPDLTFNNFDQLTFQVFNGVPYVGFRDPGNGNRATVLKYQGGAWEAVGLAGFSDGVAGEMSLQVADGIPFAAFVDEARDQKATVMRYSAGSWSPVGEKGLSSGRAGAPSVLVNGGTPLLAYYDYPANGTSVMAFNGSAWVYGGTPGEISGFPSFQLLYGSLPVIVNSVPEAGNLLTFQSFYSGQWHKTVNPDFQIDNYPPFYIDDDQLYIAYSQLNPQGKATVLKCANFTTCATVGAPGFSAGQAYNLSLRAFNQNPYVSFSSYQNGEYRVAVMKNEGTRWENVGAVGFSGVVPRTATSVRVNQGTPFVAFYKDGKLSVWRYAKNNPNPTVDSIAPLQGVNTGIAHISNLAGTGFRSGASVRLARNGQNDIWAANVVVQSATQIACDFDLTGKAPGAWDVIVTNDDARDGVLAGGFTITDVQNAWHQVGAAGFTGGAASFVSIKVNGGTPYVAFKDSANGDKASVMKFNGNAWEYVGGAGFSAGVVNYPSLSIDQDILYVAFQDANQSGKASVMKFNGNSWEYVGSAGISAGYATYTSLFVASGTPYLAFTDATRQGRAVVVKYDAGNWVPVGNAFPATGDAVYTSLYVNGGVPYVAFNNLGADSGKISVYKYPGLTGWEAVGATGFSSWSALFINLVFNNGTPYVSFIDSDSVAPTSHPPRAMKYDGSNWINAGGNVLSPNNAQYSSLAFDNAVAYSAFLDRSSGKVAVMKLNGGTWAALGDSNALVRDTVGDDYALSLFVSDGVPYLAYIDAAHGNALSVIKYSP
jgi:hypothetical protein